MGRRGDEQLMRQQEEFGGSSRGRQVEVQLSGLQLPGKMGHFERPFWLAGLCVRTWCSLGMGCVCVCQGILRLPSCLVTCVYRIPSKQGNYPACWGEQLEMPGAEPPFFPWTPILTCCRPFTQIPLPAAVAFFPISASFCAAHWQRPRCCRVLDTYIARF